MPETTKTKLLIAPCSYKAAKYAVMNWHYSRCMNCGKSQYYGAWENEKFIGSIIFGIGAGNVTLGKQYGLEKMMMAELVRVALGKHKNPVSKIISICINIVKKNNPNLRLLVSFADPTQKHLGTIYQALNWIYVGQTSKSKTYIGYDGKQYHERVISKSRIKKHYGKYTPCLSPDDCKTIRINEGKYKYLFPLDRTMRKKIEPLAKPYPKRPVGETVSRLAIQLEVSGSNPTTGLKEVSNESP